MDALAFFLSLILSGIVNFGYLANAKTYGFKKYVTAFLLLFVGLFFMNGYEGFAALYWLLTGIMLLVSGGMNREKRGKKVFTLPSLPRFKKKKKTKIEAQTYYDNSAIDSDSEITKREQLIEQLQKENDKLRKNTVQDIDDLDEWERVRNKRLRE